MNVYWTVGLAWPSWSLRQEQILEQNPAFSFPFKEKEAMTVKEAIEKLQKFPQDMMLVENAYFREVGEFTVQDLIEGPGGSLCWNNWEKNPNPFEKKVTVVVAWPESDRS